MLRPRVHLLVPVPPDCRTGHWGGWGGPAPRAASVRVQRGTRPFTGPVFNTANRTLYERLRCANYTVTFQTLRLEGWEDQFCPSPGGLISPEHFSTRPFQPPGCTSLSQTRARCHCAGVLRGATETGGRSGTKAGECGGWGPARGGTVKGQREHQETAR